MIYNTESSYPTSIDDLIFYQDIDLEHLYIMKNFEILISQGKYTEALNYISRQSNINGAFADLFNLLENRIYNTQNYLLTKTTINPIHFSETEPNISDGEFWID